MAKRPAKPVDREKLVENLFKAVQDYVEGNGGKIWVVGPIKVEVHKPTSFDLVVECVGEAAARGTIDSVTEEGHMRRTPYSHRRLRIIAETLKAERDRSLELCSDRRIKDWLKLKVSGFAEGWKRPNFSEGRLEHGDD